MNPLSDKQAGYITKADPGIGKAVNFDFQFRRDQLRKKPNQLSQSGIVS
ncbi:MAG: hypothetical protein PHH43_08250 [Candidatus Cloacimonetes bacterium]|nr:hypothetical protein [Candidatus Cloacimonadota bacterium]MDD3236298.1 hypothetical protein [Candidatus Cloacimonadota bacterium]